MTAALYAETFADRRLYRHQRLEVDEHSFDRARALLWEPRTGKTLATIEVLKRQVIEDGVRRIVIVAPQIACGSVWMPEIQAQASGQIIRLFPIPCFSREYSIAQRIEYFLTCHDRGTWQHTAAIVIVNYDVLDAFAETLIKWRPESVVFDEMHLLKSASSARSRAALRIARPAQYRRGLTGTPDPNGFIDVYGQFKILDDRVFGSSKARFVENYCVPHPRIQGKIAGYKNLPDLEKRMWSISSRVRKADVFDMPETFDVVRPVTLPATAHALYQKLKKDQGIEHSDPLAQEHGLGTIDTSHTLTRLLRLQQLTSGFLEGADGEVRWIHTAKIDTVLGECAEPLEDNAKVVVFYLFEHEGAKIAEMAAARFGPCVARLAGKTSETARLKAITDFNEPKSDLKILVVQEQVASLGISLVGADYCVFANTSWDYGVHIQARDRPFKPGAGKKLAYSHCLVPGTVDVTKHRAIKAKKTASEMLLDIGFDRMAEGDL